ncbi:hypothetical protein B0H10DRAFT_2202514 [Mycena sp. CBHHK59/15]|nr:hypothetical protein B0H10DRAFT_2202514 [Mycena sp. CBHHK59/15]
MSCLPLGVPHVDRPSNVHSVLDCSHRAEQRGEASRTIRTSPHVANALHSIRRAEARCGYSPRRWRPETRRTGAGDDEYMAGILRPGVGGKETRRTFKSPSHSHRQTVPPRLYLCMPRESHRAHGLSNRVSYALFGDCSRQYCARQRPCTAHRDRVAASNNLTRNRRKWGTQSATGSSCAATCGTDVSRPPNVARHYMRPIPTVDRQTSTHKGEEMGVAVAPLRTSRPSAPDLLHAAWARSQEGRKKGGQLWGLLGGWEHSTAVSSASMWVSVQRKRRGGGWVVVRERAASVTGHGDLTSTQPQ